MRHGHFHLMIALTALFVFRVSAQLLQALVPVSFLPSFQQWHGAVIPYSLLLITQIGIILILFFGIWRVKSDAIKPSSWKYHACFLFGGLYFSFMAFRLITGFTILADHPWFSKHLPAAFHLVLASYILLLGHYLQQKASKNLPRPKVKADFSVSALVAALSYPAVMGLGFALYGGILSAGFSVSVASYAAVLLAAALITLHELKLPFRPEWKPSAGEVGTDTLFMISVQIALPYFLSITLVIALSGYLKTSGFIVGDIWPHDFPLLTQTCLMLLIADFPRYWMHRAFHKFTSLWQFHAVHHSPHRLYWLNVGRFHPIEKAVQFTVDALPFALLGISPKVLAAYFVFYAINGFFQHSNCRVHLGPLNFIISGPELHRWHHSQKIKESDNNYGNNLIIWDLIFGTRYLPDNRLVGELGLFNRDYPTSFTAQLSAPFVKGKDKA